MEERLARVIGIEERSPPDFTLVGVVFEGGSQKLSTFILSQIVGYRGERAEGLTSFGSEGLKVGSLVMARLGDAHRDCCCRSLLPRIAFVRPLKFF